MAKKGFRAGRLAKAYIKRGGMGLAKDLIERKRNPKKYKRRDRIRRYSEDGKISKKESKKLQKRGISQQEVQRTYDKDFKASRESFDRSGRPGEYKNLARRPQYDPLIYSRGASSQFARGIERDVEPSRKKRRRAPQPSMESTDISDFQQQREDMFAQYEQLMIQQAQEAEEQRRQMEIAMRAQAQNAYSASLMPGIDLRGAGTTPKLGAAEQFRRRIGSQFGTAYQGVAI